MECGACFYEHVCEHGVELLLFDHGPLPFDGELPPANGLEVSFCHVGFAHERRGLASFVSLKRLKRVGFGLVAFHG